MNREELEQIFEETESEWEGDNTFKGMQIISKYTDNIVIAAEHDIVYCGDIDGCLESGMTREDAIELSKLNWMLEDGCFGCFV